MSTDKKQQLILVGVFEDQRCLAEMDWNAVNHLSHSERGRHRLRIHQAQKGFVPMNLAGWIGHQPTPSECVLYHREYQRLEAMGFIERHNFFGGRRTSHLRLTPSGKNTVLAILDGYEPLEGEQFEEIDEESLKLQLNELLEEDFNTKL